MWRFPLQISPRMKYLSLLPDPGSRLPSFCKETYLRTQFPIQEVRAVWYPLRCCNVLGRGQNKKAVREENDAWGACMCPGVYIQLNPTRAKFLSAKGDTKAAEQIHG